MKRLESVGTIGRFLSGAIVASLLGGTALAVDAPTVTAPAAQKKFFSISPMAMANKYVTPAPINLQGTGCYMTGVNLPQGVSMLDVTTWFRSGPASDLTIYIYRQDLRTDRYATPVHATASDDSNRRLAIRNVVPTQFRTVDNTNYSYGYAVCVGSDGQFTGARIGYR